MRRENVIYSWNAQNAPKADLKSVALGMNHNLLRADEVEIFHFN